MNTINHLFDPLDDFQYLSGIQSERIFTVQNKAQIKNNRIEDGDPEKIIRDIESLCWRFGEWRGNQNHLTIPRARERNPERLKSVFDDLELNRASVCWSSLFTATMRDHVIPPHLVGSAIGAAGYGLSLNISDSDHPFCTRGGCLTRRFTYLLYEGYHFSLFNVQPFITRTEYPVIPVPNISGVSHIKDNDLADVRKRLNLCLCGEFDSKSHFFLVEHKGEEALIELAFFGAILDVKGPSGEINFACVEGIRQLKPWVHLLEYTQEYLRPPKHYHYRTYQKPARRNIVPINKEELDKIEGVYVDFPASPQRNLVAEVKLSKDGIILFNNDSGIILPTTRKSLSCSRFLFSNLFSITKDVYAVESHILAHMEKMSAGGISNNNFLVGENPAENPFPYGIPPQLNSHVIDDLKRFNAARVALQFLLSRHNTKNLYDQPHLWADALNRWRELYSSSTTSRKIINKTISNTDEDIHIGVLLLLRRCNLNRQIGTGLHGCLTRELFRMVHGKDPVGRRTPVPPVEDHEMIPVFECLSRTQDEQLRRAVRRFRSFFLSEDSNDSIAVHTLAEALTESARGYFCDKIKSATDLNEWVELYIIRTSRPVIYENKNLLQRATPPIKLPQLPGITFLGSADQIIEEGKIMRHCVGTYTQKASDGRCFLFHVEHHGEHATVEVSPNGKVIQSEGPVNTQNNATIYGRNALSAWAESITSPAYQQLRDKFIDEERLKTLIDQERLKIHKLKTDLITQETVIRLKQLALEVENEDDTVLEELLYSYISDTMCRIEYLYNFTTRSQLSAIKEHLHAIKVSSTVIGAELLADICREIEGALWEKKHSAPEIVPLYIPRMLAVFEATQAALRNAFFLCDGSPDETH